MGLVMLLRRWAADRATAMASMLTIWCALVVLAAGPTYADAVSIAALRDGVVSGEAAERTVEVSITGELSDEAGADVVTSTELSNVFAPMSVATTRMRVAQRTFGIAGAGAGADGDGPADVAQLVAIDGIGTSLETVDGSPPTDGAAADPAAGDLVDVWLHPDVADVLGLAVGDRPQLVSRTGEDRTIPLVVAGLVRPSDPTDLVWTGRAAVADGVRESASFRTSTFLIDPAAFDTVGEASRPSWLAVPDFGTIRPEDPDRVVGGVAALDDRLTRVLRPPDPASTWELEVVTEVPNHLRDNSRSLTVARSTVLAVMASLAVIVGVAVALMSTLTIEARRSDTAWWWARGAATGQIVRGVLAELAIVTIPAVVLAPLLAAVVVRPLEVVGPLAEVELDLQPEPVRSAWLVVAVAAVVMVVAAIAPVWRERRQAERAASGRADTASAGWQRAGADLAVVGLAAAAWWQVASLGDDRAASIRGRFGVDPLVVVAPTLGLLAGVLLSARVVSMLARRGDATATKRTGLVGALAAWELARRPARYRQAAMFLVAASAFVVYSLSFDATWTRSQLDQADVRVPADLVVAPDEREAFATPSLLEAATHRAVSGVERSIAAFDRSVELAGDDGRLLAVDSDAVADLAATGVVSERLDGDDGFVEAASTLAAARPELDGLLVPEGATALQLQWSLVLDPPVPGTLGPPDAQLPPIPIAFNVSALLRDGDGLLHRIDGGNIILADRYELAEGTIEFSLAQRFDDGRVAMPSAPLVLVDVELGANTSIRGLATGEITLGPLTASTPTGVGAVALDDADWSTAVTLLGQAQRRPEIELVEVGPALLRLDYGTGADFSPVPARLRISAASGGGVATPTGVATGEWLAERGVAVGDRVAVGLSSSVEASVEIVASVALVPGDDVDELAALMVDLPTLQAWQRGQGLAVAEADQYWIVLADGAGESAVERDLQAEPIEAAGVASRLRARTDLVADPPALAAIGGLALGSTAATIIAGIGVVTAAVVAVRDRRREFALLMSVGASPRELRRSLALEQGATVGVALLLGTVIGLVLAVLVLPVVSLSSDGASVVPDVLVDVPWRRIAMVQAGVLVGLVGATAVAMRSTAGLELAGALRRGDG